jgi:hypothetical protein
MQTIEQLEKRLQIEQEALARADLFGNEIAQALYREGVARAEKRLHDARVRAGEY